MVFTHSGGSQKAAARCPGDPWKQGILRHSQYHLFKNWTPPEFQSGLCISETSGSGSAGSKRLFLTAEQIKGNRKKSMIFPSSQHPMWVVIHSLHIGL